MSYPYEMAVFAARNREIVYETVVKALEKSAEENGVTQKGIAEAMGRKPSQVSAWLSGPSNWTLDTVSDLLRAVGASMTYRVVFDKDRVPSNYGHDAGQLPVPLANTDATAATAASEVVVVYDAEEFEDA
jgi:hypothetical protein